MSLLSVVLPLAVSWLAPAAHAEQSDVLPPGAHTVYGGVGINTYRKLQFIDGAGGEPQELDRALRTRLDLYWATGLASRVQLSAALPLVHSTVLDGDDTGPCPELFSEEQYCEGFVRPGQLSVAGRVLAVDRDLGLAVDLALQGDPWNAGLRGRYTAYGEGTVDLRPGLTVDWDAALGEWGLRLVGSGSYVFRFSRLIEEGSAAPFRAPADHVAGLAEFQLMPPGAVSFTVGTAGMTRLWGLDWDSDYQAEYFPTDDRWTVLWYRQLSAYGKVSVALPQDMGLHLGAGRVVAVRNGPPDTWDFTVGVHKYYGPRG